MAKLIISTITGSEQSSATVCRQSKSKPVTVCHAEGIMVTRILYYLVDNLYVDVVLLHDVPLCAFEASFFLFER